MIWIFEYITKEELKKLRYLSPILDFRYDVVKGMYYWKTYFHSFGKSEFADKFNDEEDHKSPQNRKIRLYNIENTKKGFICDDFEEAKKLCTLIKYQNDISWKSYFEDIIGEYPWIQEYINRNKDYFFLEIIALTLKAYLEYFKDDDSYMDLIDLENMYNERFYKFKDL